MTEFAHLLMCSRCAGAASDLVGTVFAGSINRSAMSEPAFAECYESRRLDSKINVTLDDNITI